MSIQRNADAVLRQAESVSLLPRAFLRSFLEQDVHVVSEVTLFAVLLRRDAEFQKDLVPFIRLRLIPTATIMKSKACSLVVCSARLLASKLWHSKQTQKACSCRVA